MSSLIRRIQLSPKRKHAFQGRGSQLGVSNQTGKERLARIAREARKELNNGV